MDEDGGGGSGAKAGESREARLRRVAGMFSPHRDDPIMRELCRLAVKCVQEGWTNG